MYKFLFNEIDLLKNVYLWVAVGLAVVALILAVAFFVVRARLKKERDDGNTRVEKVKTIDGVRYTESDRIIKNDGSIKVTHQQKDIILERGKTYVAKKGGLVLPGKYTVLSADENAATYNVRLGGYVREVSHNSSIVLAEGDEITSVSHTVVLR